MTPPARRALFSLIVFFAVCAVAGTFLQRRVGAQSSQDESQIRDSLKSFTDVYALVEQNYAEPIQRRQGRHRHLRRRHSRHAPRPRSALQLLRSQGLRQDARRPARPLLRRRHGHPAADISKVYVITPYEGTPSFRAGIRPGDIIAAIDGKVHRRHDLRRRSPRTSRDPRAPTSRSPSIREGQTKPLSFRPRSRRDSASLRRPQIRDPPRCRLHPPHPVPGNHRPGSQSGRSTASPT